MNRTLQGDKPDNRALWLALGWTLAILAACSIPGSTLPDVDVDWADKVVHFGMFAVLSVLWMRAGSGRHTTLLVLVGGLAYAVGTEYYQGWLPWERTPDELDMLANAVGLVVGVLIYTIWNGTLYPSDL